MNPIHTLRRGTLPLLISCPHDGSLIPPEMSVRMVPEARRAPDTDWHVSTLYAFAHHMGASILQPHHSRYVVDLNRPPDDVSLYPGQNTTGLCPTVQFSGKPVYLDGELPSADEVAIRVQRYWQPYHDALAGELARLHQQHGRVVLWEAHSIRSVVPFLFDGRLPDLNLGTAAGASCNAATQARLQTVLDGQQGYSHVVNGRFKGGYITRHYAQPEQDIEAIQLELAQFNYMDENTYEYLPDRAATLQRVIRQLLDAALG